MVDEGSLLEIQPKFGSAVVTALARLGGEAVAIVANDPMVKAGTVDPTHAATRPRTSSRSPTRSTCRWCCSPTTRA